MHEETPEWQQLRSDIYIRDKGICWVCNLFVDLADYDLGHLIDRCNGGKLTYDNLAVMHSVCNASKPRHSTLEEAIKWRMTPSFCDRPKPKALPLSPMSNTSELMLPTFPSTIKQHKGTNRIISHYHDGDSEAIRQLIIEFFTSRPDLLANSDGYNRDRLKATSELCKALGVTPNDVRDCLRNAGLVNKRKPQITDGSQYRFVLEHLTELLEKYETIKHDFLYDQPKKMGMTHFCMDIMFYLAGRFDKVSKTNYLIIQKRVSELRLPVRNMPS